MAKKVIHLMRNTFYVRDRFMIVLIMAATIFTSCEKNKSKLSLEEDHNAMEPMPLDTFNFLLKQIKQYGDTVAYNRLSVECFYFHKKEQLLYYAMIMANKHNYGCASAHAADLLLSINQENLNELDPRTKKLAIYYAIRAQELGYDIKINPIYRDIIDTLPKSSVYLNL